MSRRQAEAETLCAAAWHLTANDQPVISLRTMSLVRVRGLSADAASGVPRGGPKSAGRPCAACEGVLAYGLPAALPGGPAPSRCSFCLRYGLVHGVLPAGVDGRLTGRRAPRP